MPKNLKTAFGIFILGAVLGLAAAIPRLVTLQFDFGLFRPYSIYFSHWL